MHARRASIVTGTLHHRRASDAQQFFRALEGQTRKSRPAGQTIIDKHGGQAHLGMHGRGDAAEVVAIGHYQQRQHADSRVFKSMDGAHEMQKPLFQGETHVVRNFKPQPFGFKNMRRHIQRHDGQQTIAGHGPLFIPGNGLGDAQPSQMRTGAPYPPGSGDFQNFRALGAAYPRKPGDSGRFGAHRAAAGVQRGDYVGHATVQVDRAGMRLPPGAEAVHKSDDCALGILDAEGIPAAAQIHMPLGPLARGQQLRAVGGAQQHPLPLKLRHGANSFGKAQPRPVRALGRQGLFGGRTLQMTLENHFVARIDHGPLGRATEKILGMTHKILIQSVLARHQNNGRLPARPTYAAAPLQRGHHRAGIPHQNADIQAADVDAQFQSAGADHGQQLSRGHALLDVPALLGQKPGPVGGYTVLPLPGLPGGPYADQFGHAPGTAVDNRAQPPRQCRLEQSYGRCGRAVLGIHEHKMSRSPRRAGNGDHVGRRRSQRLTAHELSGQLAGIAHGSCAEYIGRARAVASRNPVESPEKLGHVRAEYPPVGMRFIHHHMRQTRQKGRPLLVVGQYRQMQHFRIGDQHRRRVTPDLAPKMIRGVAVVNGDCGAGFLRPMLRQRAKTRRLIPRQRLERKKI